MADPRNKRVKNEFSGEWEIETPPGAAQEYWRLGSTLTIIMFMLTVIFAAVVAMWIKLLDFAFASIVGSIFNVFCIQFFGRVYEKAAIKLNDMENFRTETSYQDSLIVKNFLFQFVNNYFALVSVFATHAPTCIPPSSPLLPSELCHGRMPQFFIAFLKEGQIFGEQSTCQSQIIDCDTTDTFSNSTCTPGTELECKYTCIDRHMEVTSCMAELQTQLFVVFAVKQFAFQVAAGGAVMKNHVH
jgi:hypothetical protein